ncbi:MAG TPA: right-handed parallel beta-helix repeat-containing protein [Anaerohalosphaeraceae bacterium]|nr:right-handed parallel beta-helix repeat-containing protein [Anaerohalosphaeraceae bacterium]
MMRSFLRGGGVFVWLAVGWPVWVWAAEYYVSPAGSDTNSGTVSSPFKTIGRAVTAASAGDTIFLRGGQHPYSAKVSISKSGTSLNPITLRSYPGETVVLDFSGTPTGTRGIELSGSYWVFYDFVIQNAGDNALYITGGYNQIERITARWNEDSGIQLHTGAAYNLLLNCDSYENYDPANHGENADGFAVKFGVGAGNILQGCRAWSNSDDGYDCWNTDPPSQAVTFERCWAFRNGINLWGDAAFAGDGNGFKLGAGSGGHFLVYCAAFDNPHHGIDVNGNITGVTVYQCSGIRNGGRNFYFDEHNSAHVLRNNLSHLGSVLMYEEIDDQFNSWNGFVLTDDDFAGLDSAEADGPREADGSLPRLSFARLRAGSAVIDAGAVVGLAYLEAGPDLGAFEFIPGDCAADGRVDLLDVERLAEWWLMGACGRCGGADFNGSGSVNLSDWKKAASYWLRDNY